MHLSELDKTFNMPIGEFVTASPNIIVTDPSNDIGTWCQDTIKNARIGRWKASVCYSDEKMWGTRVSSIQITHEDLSLKQLPDMDWIRQKASIGVDSGQAGFFQLERYHEDGRGEYGKDDTFYGKICNLTLSDKQAGVIEYGCASSSGFGDGVYRLETIENKEKETVAARIVFITSEEDEEDYDDE
jgi:hypothetical protein